MTTRARGPIALTVLMLAGCAEVRAGAPPAASEAGAPSPDAALDTLLGAFAQGDPVALARALPTDARLARALACPPGRGPAAALAPLRAKLTRELLHTRGVGFARAGVEILDTRAFAPGDDAAGCQVREPVELRIVRLALDTIQDGRTERTREQAVVIALMGQGGAGGAGGATRWYVLDY